MRSLVFSPLLCRISQLRLVVARTHPSLPSPSDRRVLGCHLLQDMDLLTASRTQQGQQQGLKGEALAQFVGTQTLLPSDPPLKEDSLLEYSVKAF